MTRQKITLTVVVAMLLSFAAAAVHAEDGVKPVQALAVVDVNGKTVGNVLGIDGSGARIALKVKGNLIVLSAVTAGFYGTDTLLYFTSFDCSGPAMFVPSIVGVLPDDVPRTAVIGTQVYVPAGRPELVTPNSELSFYPGSTGVCYSGTGGTDNFRAARFLIDLGTQFSAPFSVIATPAQN